MINQIKKKLRDYKLFIFKISLSQRTLQILLILDFFQIILPGETKNQYSQNYNVFGALYFFNLKNLFEVIFKQYIWIVLTLLITFDVITYIMRIVQLSQLKRKQILESDSALTIIRKDVFELDSNFFFLFVRGQIIINLFFSKDPYINSYKNQYYGMVAGIILETVTILYFFICLLHTLCLMKLQMRIIQIQRLKNFSTMLDYLKIFQKLFILCFYNYFDSSFLHFANLLIISMKIKVIKSNLTYNDAKVRFTQSILTKIEFIANSAFILQQFQIIDKLSYINILLIIFISIFLFLEIKNFKSIFEKSIYQQTFLQIFDSLTLINCFPQQHKTKIYNLYIIMHQTNCKKVSCFCNREIKENVAFKLITVQQLKEKIDENLCPFDKTIIKIQLNQLIGPNLKVFTKDIQKLKKLETLDKKFNKKRLFSQFYPIILKKIDTREIDKEIDVQQKNNYILIEQIEQIAHLQQSIIEQFQSIQNLEKFLINKDKQSCKKEIYLYHQKMENLKKQKPSFYNQYLILIPFFQLLVQDTQFNLNIKNKFKKFIELTKQKQNFDVRNVYNFNKNIFLSAGCDQNNQFIVNKIFGDTKKILNQNNEYYLHQSIRKLLVPQFKQIHQEIIGKGSRYQFESNDHLAKVLLQKGNIQIQSVQMFLKCIFDIFTENGLQYRALIQSQHDQKAIVLNEEGYIVGLGSDMISLLQDNLLQFVQVPFYYYGKQLLNYFSNQEKISKIFGVKKNFESFNQSCWKLRDNIYLDFYSKQITLDLMEIYKDGIQEIEKFRQMQNLMFQKNPPSYSVQVYIDKLNGSSSTFYQVFFEKIEKIKVIPKQVSITSKFKNIKAESKNNKQIETVSNEIKRNSISKSKLFQKDTKFNKSQIQELIEIQKTFKKTSKYNIDISNLDIIPEQKYEYKIKRKSVVKRFNQFKAQKFTHNFLICFVLFILFCAIILIFNVKVYFFENVFIQNLKYYHSLQQYMIQFDTIISYFNVNSYLYNYSDTHDFSLQFFQIISKKTQQLLSHLQSEYLSSPYSHQMNKFMAQFRNLLTQMSVLYDNDIPFNQRISNMHKQIENQQISKIQDKFLQTNPIKELNQIYFKLHFVVIVILILTIVSFLISVFYDIKFNKKKDYFLQSFLNQVLQKKGIELEKTVQSYKMRTRDCLYKNNVNNLNKILDNQNDIKEKFSKLNMKIFEAKNNHVSKKLIVKFFFFIFGMSLLVVMNFCCLNENTVYMSDILQFQNFLVKQFIVPFQQISYFQKYMQDDLQYNDNKGEQKLNMELLMEQIHDYNTTVFQFKKQNYKKYQLEYINELISSQHIQLCQLKEQNTIFAQKYCEEYNQKNQSYVSLIAKNFRSIFQKQMDLNIFFVRQNFYDKKKTIEEKGQLLSQYYINFYRQLGGLELYGLYIQQIQFPKIIDALKAFKQEESQLFLQKSILIFTVCILLLVIAQQYVKEKPFFEYEKNFKIYNSCNQLHKILNQKKFSLFKLKKQMNGASTNKNKQKKFIIKKKNRNKSRIKSQPLKQCAWNYMLCEQKEQKIRLQKSEYKHSKYKKNIKLNLFSIRKYKNNHNLNNNFVFKQYFNQKKIFENQYSVQKLKFYINFFTNQNQIQDVDFFVQQHTNYFTFAKKKGIKIIKNKKDCKNFTILFWFSQYENVFSQLNSYQKVNYFPGSDCILSKENVYLTMQKKLFKYPNIYNFVLKNFLIPQQIDQVLKLVENQEKQRFLIQTQNNLCISSNYHYVFLKVFSKIGLEQINFCVTYPFRYNFEIYFLYKKSVCTDYRHFTVKNLFIQKRFFNLIFKHFWKRKLKFSKQSSKNRIVQQWINYNRNIKRKYYKIIVVFLQLIRGKMQAKLNVYKQLLSNSIDRVYRFQKRNIIFFEFRKLIEQNQFLNRLVLIGNNITNFKYSWYLQQNKREKLNFKIQYRIVQFQQQYKLYTAFILQQLNERHFCGSRLGKQKI